MMPLIVPTPTLLAPSGAPPSKRGWGPNAAREQRASDTSVRLSSMSFRWVIPFASILLAACGDSTGTGGAGGTGASSAGGSNEGGQAEGGANSGGGATGGGGGGTASLACEDICPAVVDAGCTGGPPTVDACVTGCEAILAGNCAAAYSTLYECGGDAPTYSCDDQGRVVVDGCETEQTALYDCLAGA